MDPNPLVETLLAQAAEAAAAGSGCPSRPTGSSSTPASRSATPLAIVPYLRDLGITHCYASPYLKARPGSTHGYDIIDHGCLNPEIGTEEEYEAWVAALHAQGLGQILDTVPNHMAVGTNENAWWNDVLENGESSRYGAYFDIAWRASPRPELKDKILLPVLGEPYGDVLEAGQTQAGLRRRSVLLPLLRPPLPGWPRAATPGPGAPARRAGARRWPRRHHALIEYQSILTAIRNLPERSETDPAKVAEHQREKEVIKRAAGEPRGRAARPARAFIEQNIAHL